MCGRYYWKRKYDLDRAPFAGRAKTPFDTSPNWNVAPTQEVPIIRTNLGEEEGGLTLAHWGLVPFWSKDKKFSSKMINARLETAASKPAFRTPFRRRRCLVPADGYYEWKTTKSGVKQPYAIYPETQETFFMGGLWDTWKSTEGLILNSFSILTREAAPVLSELHHRMPLILREGAFEPWLDPDLQSPEKIEEIIDAYSIGDEFHFHPVSTRVNSVRNNDPELIRPVPLQTALTPVFKGE